MKRRTFLSMFGAATVAPALPALPAAAPSKSIWGLAKLHAKKHPFVSVLGLSHRLGVPKQQAEGLIADLSQRGIIGPLNITDSRPVYATSRVYVPTKGSLIEAARQQRAERAARAKAFDAHIETRAKAFDVDLTRFLAHLRGLCADRGMTLATMP